MRTIDLYSGAGGFTTGAKQAGAQIVMAANHWPAALACHKANHPGVIHFGQDLAEFDWTQAPEAELVIAGPACQGHSQAGQPARNGTGGNFRPNRGRAIAQGQRDRNTAWAVLACADTVRPVSLIIENVPDFQLWEAFEAWCNVLGSFGYHVEVHTLNGLDYGGAQDRPRTVVTASLRHPVRLAPSSGAARGSIGACLDPLEFAGNRWTEVAAKPERMRWRIAKAQREAGRLCFWANVSESRGRRLDEPFPTSTTKSGSQWCLVDGDRIRILNPREIARSMSFPESLILPPQRGIAGKLVGNAIDVRLARGIVEQTMAA